MKPGKLLPWLFFLVLLLAGEADADESQSRVATSIPLRGIVLRQALKDFVPGGVEVGGLDLAASPVAAADPMFRAKAEAMLGRPITLDALQALSAEVVLAYRRAGRPLADAAVPEQNISKGTVQVIILEAHLGNVSVEGANHFSAEHIKAALRTRPGEPLVAGVMFSDLDWLNKNPFRRVDLVYARGADLGTTDVVLRVTEQRPWLAFAGYDNDNVDALGRDRWFAGVRAGNLWGREQQLSLLYSQGRSAGIYRGLALDYVVPLRWHDQLGVTASFAEPKVHGGVFGSEGRSWRVGLRYGRELPRTRLWELNWTAGYDIRSSNNDILFGGTNVFSAAYQTHEFFAELTGRRPGPFGESTARLAIYVSPGDIGDRNSSADLSRAGRPRIGACYAYADLGAGHTFPLPAECSLIASAGLRLTGDRLPPSSEFSLGGAGQLPGYAEASALGDGAVWGQLKLQSPVWHVFRREVTAAADAVRFSAVYSAGRVAIRDLTATEVGQGLGSHRQLESVALGASYEYSRRLQLNFTYGWQLRAAGAGAARSSRGHVSAVLNF
jgi:hemolysin activation/secretion protein